MIPRLVVLVAIASAVLFGAPDETDKSEIRKTIQALKATVGQLQDQIAVLESQLAADKPRSVNDPGATSTTTPVSSAVPLSTPAPAVNTTAPPAQQSAVRLNETARQQCTAITRRGTRCSRMAAPGKTTCWQH